VDIAAESHPNCILCNGPGRFVHIGEQDRLFGAPGLWNFKACRNRECGLIWLDPMPVPEHIPRAYANYYTHAPSGRPREVGLIRKAFQTIEESYLRRKYGYSHEKAWTAARIVGPLVHAYFSEDCRTFLSHVPHGALLELGCGAGEYLLSMRRLGWNVEGVETDPAAVIVARERGLNVQVGGVEEQNYSSNRFDAIALNHVIEHLIDPMGTLKECARILKPGGHILIFTPNSESMSHRLFGGHWRGLEPPRHLHIFSARSLETLLTLSGFHVTGIYPQIGSSLVRESVLLSVGAAGHTRAVEVLARVFARCFAAVELLTARFHPAVADCVAAMGIKK
jgi:SAM-dependent methyltransferase